MQFSISAVVTTATPTEKWDSTEVFPSAETHAELDTLEARILALPGYMENDHAHAALYCIDAIRNMSGEAERQHRLFDMVRDCETRTLMERDVAIQLALCAGKRAMLDSHVAAIWAKA